MVTPLTCSLFATLNILNVLNSLLTMFTLFTIHNIIFSIANYSKLINTIKWCISNNLRCPSTRGK